MRRRSAVPLLVAPALLLGGASAAHGAIVGPTFSFSPHTKAAPSSGTAVTLTLRWAPTQFLPPSATDKQEVDVTPEGGSLTTFSAGSTQASIPLLLQNGRVVTVEVMGCQTPTCDPAAFGTVASGPQTTRVDATPPSGTLRINGGAAATNDRNVTLEQAATDPLIEGIPGSSSGVTQSATDIDGDGALACSFIVIGGGTPDTSGCAVPFAPTRAALLPAGDGLKTVGVVYGDGARENTVPCTGIFCGVVILGAPILGNASAAATDTILLDTVKPVAIATQDRFTVTRGGSVDFDSATSLDPGVPSAASGVNGPATTWTFNDGTPTANGAKVSHAYNRTGTFVGELRVRDVAGNVSDVRQFSVTVDPAPGDRAAGGSIAGVTGTAAFSLSRLKVTARYVRSRLKGSLRIDGTSTRAGNLRVDVRRATGRRVIARFRSKLPAAAFSRRLMLPASLTPGSYRLALVGPGGTLRTRLTLKAPREGVIRSGRVIVGATATARFTFAAQPAGGLRRLLTITWTQAGRRVGLVKVPPGRIVSGPLPGSAAVGPGVLVATLKAGDTVVGSARVRLR